MLYWKYQLYDNATHYHFRILPKVCQVLQKCFYVIQCIFIGIHGQKLIFKYMIFNEYEI